MRALRTILALLLLACFAAADVLRTPAPRTASLLAAGAWTVFVAIFTSWAWEGRGWRTATRDAGRIVVLTVVSLVVLHLYYARSGLLEAGVNVDAVYTYIGLQWFFELRYPITFVGVTYSYHQLPLALFSHLPALAVGFDRLGPFAMQFGLMVQIALLLAVATDALVAGHLPAKVLAVILASAAYSNRMLVITYDKPGNAIPAICLGLMFLILVDDEVVPQPDRLVGGLLAVALLHHYPGWVFVLPMCLGWLVLRRRPWAGLRAFMSKNPVLLLVVCMSVITLSTHPDLVIARVRDVSAYGKGTEFFYTRVLSNVNYLRTTFAAAWWRMFFVQNLGSWQLLNYPPLGGALVPLLVGGWVLSACNMSARWWRYVGALGVFTVGLVGLSLLQHVVTDMYDYRDFTFCFAMMLTGFTALFRLPKLDRARLVITLGYALLVAIYNYRDLGTLHGKVHITLDYAPRPQGTMESLRRFIARSGGGDVSAGKIYVVLDEFFPLRPFYLAAFERRGLHVEPIKGEDYCSDAKGVVHRLATAGCEPFVLVVDASQCTPKLPGDDGAAAVRRVVGYRYESTCGKTTAGSNERIPITFAIEPAS